MRRSILIRIVACAVCATVALGSAPTAASAKSAAALAAERRSRQKQAAALEKQLEATRPALMDALARVDEVDARLQDLRSRMQDTDATLMSLGAEISAAETVLNERAVSLYKSGGFEVFEAFLSVRSLDDLLTRIDLLSYIQSSDDELLNSLAQSRNQAAFLQTQQQHSEEQLILLRQEADTRKAIVESVISRQAALLASAKTDVARLAREEATARAAEAAAQSGTGGVADPPVGFEPNTLVSDAVFTDSGAMSAADIQTFLNSQSGDLKSYMGRDHAGVTRSATDMIAAAAAAWGVNPRVILVTLQKEQSLISDSTPSQRALDWAMGCGKMDGSTLNQYKGFGNQIWGGARALARNRSYWRVGLSLSIDGQGVYPANPSTHSLYRYTPHLHGNVMFWRLFWRYFGNPVG